LSSVLGIKDSSYEKQKYFFFYEKRSGNRPVEEGDWRIGRSPPENLLHGRPVSEVFLQPLTVNFKIATIKGVFQRWENTDAVLKFVDD
jgi:hypothetical protein